MPASTTPEQKKARYEAVLRCAARNRRVLADYKLLLGCADCGYDDHACALEFDHLPGTEKRFNIGTASTSRFLLLVEEIAKCDVVCSNCHKVRTWVRR